MKFSRLIREYRRSINPPYNRKDVITILVTLLILIAIPLTVLGIKTGQELRTKAAVPLKADLDVTYISRTPRYYRYDVIDQNGLGVLRPGTENNKRWPDVGEAVTYTAHVINKGRVSVVGGFTYQWLVDGAVVKSGSVTTSLNQGTEATVDYQTTWPASPQSIQFKVDTPYSEISQVNNSLTIGSHDLTISYWVEQGYYDMFNQTLNLVGTYSFEDWIEAHFAQMNQRFSQAKYPVAPNGIRDRVRIDKIVIADQLDTDGCPSNPMSSDPDVFFIDGRWQSTDGDCTNARGQGGEIQRYVNQYVNQIDWGLIHEVAHQLGVIDLYRLGIPPDPYAIQVTNNWGQVIDISQMPPIFPHSGLMAGGDTSPYNDGTYFESHTAGGLNSNYNDRRGYYGEYLYDTPANNYLKILDSSGNPISGAQVALYQKDVNTEFTDNTPEITGATNSQGLVFLTNRPVNGVTTATGHTLRANPFGQIDVVGRNGNMLVKITKGFQEDYRWLFILDLNIAYWSGNTGSATYVVNTSIQTVPAGDTTPPTVTITAPTSGATVSGMVSPTATATDNVGVARVEFYLDGVAKSSAIRAPYSWNWPSYTVSNGSHVLGAKAYDTSGNAGLLQQVTVATNNNLCDNSVPKDTFHVCFFSGDRLDSEPLLGQRDEGATTSPAPTTSTPILHNWGDGGEYGQTDNFSGVWRGSINFPAGSYKFKVTSDDGVRLDVGNDGTYEIDEWKDQPPASYETNSIALNGYTPIKLEWYENGGGAYVSLGWQPGGGAKPGDLDSDGDVDILDLSKLITLWGATGGVADINKDGIVNVYDLSILLSNWGT